MSTRTTVVEKLQELRDFTAKWELEFLQLLGVPKDGSTFGISTDSSVRLPVACDTLITPGWYHLKHNHESVVEVVQHLVLEKRVVFRHSDDMVLWTIEDMSETAFLRYFEPHDSLN